ncbi:Transcriptional regulator, LysR family [plant metagenome]|uniref:Transcriptional regulator, LysR family n=1 Tax=plant metagenome TaxID=1297885 RepID=A0A484PEE6_9ZZZZ
MNLNRLNWNDLRIFLAVGQASTLCAAARQLGVNESTASRHVSHLEQVIGELVFTRDHQGFHLTPRGRELFEYVQEMEKSALAFTEALSGARQDVAGRVRVATMEGIATLYLSGAFAELRRRHPGLEVELLTSAELVHVNRRQADVFLSFFPSEGRGLEAAPVGEFQLHLYGSEEYLAVHGRPASRADLSNHVFVSYVDDLVQLDTVRWLTEGVDDPKVVFHSTSMLAQMFAAAAGTGLVMLPTFARAERFGLVPLLTQEIRVPRIIWLTVHRDQQYSRRVKAVTGFLREILRRDYPCAPGIKPT